MKARLVVVGGEAKAGEFDLKLPTIVGRGREVSLTLPHPLVSREHCEIYESNGRLFVRDLGSLNGTFINNLRIEGEAELPAGELLTIGTVTFRADYAVSASAPSADTDGKVKTVRAPAAGRVAAGGADDSTEQSPVSPQVDADQDLDGFADLDLDDSRDRVEPSDQQEPEQRGPQAPIPEPVAPTAERQPLSEPLTPQLPNHPPAAKPPAQSTPVAESDHQQDDGEGR